ncbi:MAG: AsmA-like C-terminal region-containing protein, partial [Pseudomonadota bacterium]
EGLLLGGEGGSGDPAAQFDAIARVMDGFVGDMEPVDELSRLRVISILGIDLTFTDEEGGQSWRTEGASLRITRNEAGARATFRARVDDGVSPPTPLTVLASRAAGSGITEIEATFQDVRPRVLSAQFPELDWAELIDARLSGRFSGSLNRAGEMGPIKGKLRAREGRLTVENMPVREFNRVALDFTYIPADERLRLSTLSIEAPDLEGEMAGLFDILRRDGEIEAIAGQLDLSQLRLSAPEIFAETLSFDGGQVVLRADLDPMEVRVSDAHLTKGDLIFGLNAHIRATEAGPVTDLRASGRNVSVAALMAHWPLAAAENARDWIETNISQGLVEQVVAHIRIDRGEPQLSLDFAFRDLVSEYIEGMSPITGASGRGHLTFHDLFLFLDEGVVSPLPGTEIPLAGSELVFRDLWGAVTPAEVRLTGEGPLDAILTLINQQPLGLVGKLGLEPGDISGDARVAAEITFPLLNDLLLDQVTAEVLAELTDVAMPFTLSGRALDVRSERVVIDGSTLAMEIAGEVSVDGTPLDLTWREDYGAGADHRRIEARGTLTPALLAQFGGEVPGFAGGSAQAEVTVEQRGGASVFVDLEADLAAAALDLADIDWQKAAGSPGRLRLVGQLGEEVALDRIVLTAEGLELDGAVRLGPDGSLREADIDRLILDDRADVGLVARPAGEGLSVILAGRRLNLSSFDPEGPVGSPGGESPELDIQFSLRELQLTDEITLDAVEGKLATGRTGTSGEVRGQIGDGIPVAASYTGPEGSAAEILITSPNAGGILEHLDIYTEASGGELTLRATRSPDARLEGLLKVRDLALSDGEQITRVLRAGRFGDEDIEVVNSGLVFRTVRVPFVYQDGRIEVGEAYAKSPSLAITARGGIDQEADQIDLVGAISPAYGVTGALDNVPVLRQIFSGGREGEGVFAMTFSMSG